MSGLYIPGMEMPTEGFVEILIRDDGTVQQTGQSYRVDGADYYSPYVGEMPVIYKAIPVPDHGRLLKVLKTERECVCRNCDRNCEKCDLSLEQSEILAAYDALISVFSAPADSPRCEPCQPTQPECGNCEWADKEGER